MSVAFTPKKGLFKKVNTEGYIQAFLARERERELPIILKLQAYRSTFLDWYFFIASVLGEEVFFISFVPFVCWNLSRQVALHLTFLLVFSVGGGNMLKNLLQSPRPPHKIVWVNKTNPELDPGFPSTHTMTAFTIPWYLIVFYWDVISLSTKLSGLAILLLWSLSIASSRVYNGHHFLIDVFGGFLLSVGILGIWSHYLRFIVDSVIFSPSIFYPMMVIACAVLLLYIHPQAASPNPAAAETALVFGTCLGTMFAVWLQKSTQAATGFGYTIMDPLPIFSDLWAIMAARFVIGVIAVATIREVSKLVFLPLLLLCYNKLNNLNSANASPALQTKKVVYNKTNYKYSPVEVSLKLITYSAVSFTVVSVPHLCCMLGLFHESDLLVFK